MSKMIWFKEVFCNISSDDVSFKKFSVKIEDVKRIDTGGIVQPTGEKFSEIIVVSYEQDVYTTKHKVIGGVAEINDSMNTLYHFHV